MKNLSFLFLILIAFACVEQKEECKFPELKGEYLGQELPGDSAVLFAPGIVSTGMADRDISITPDGKEIYFCKSIGDHKFTTIFVTKQINNKWTKPEVFEFCKNPKYSYLEPHISPDGQNLFFASNMPVNDSVQASSDIWVCERNGDHWENPFNLGKPINSDENEFFPSVTKDGTLYFTRPDPETGREHIYRSKFVDEKYSEPEKLNEKVNCGMARFNALISPNEDFIIVPVWGMEDSYGGTDYYIVFRNENDTWSEPVNMGPVINSDDLREWSASFSPDGKYLFFMSSKGMNEENQPSELTFETFEILNNSPQNGYSDIYWVNTNFIKNLKKDAVFN